MKTITVECPDVLHEQLQMLVREGWVKGWVKDPEHAVLEAPRRFLDSHRPDLLRAQVLGKTGA